MIAKDLVQAEVDSRDVHAALDGRMLARKRKAVDVALALLLEKNGSDRGDRAIAGTQVGRLFGVERVDGEWREPDGGVFAERIEDVGVTGAPTAGLGNKERIVTTVITICPIRKVRQVDVGGINVDGGAGCLPDINNTRLRTSTWIVARGRAFARQPCVHVHGKFVGSFTLGGQRLDITGIIPCHEDLVRARGVTEYLSPRAGGFLALLPPEFAKLGIERVAVDLEVVGQLWRDG